MTMDCDHYRISSAGHQKICMTVLQKVGLSPQGAGEVSASLLFADLRGIDSHGISRLKLYTDNARTGYFNPSGEPEVVSDRGGAICIDGHNGFGAHIATFAMTKTIERARQIGIALCTVRHSTHFGAAGYYSMMALEHDCIGLALSNALPMVAPHASRRPQVGTNPLSVAFPTLRNRPYVLDMATSVAAGGKIVNHAREGKPIPLGWACDRDGNPTSDAREAMKGYYLPLGGYKGSGIALAIDMLCGVLSSGQYGLHIVKSSQLGPDRIQDGPGIGHLFAAIDIAFYRDPEAFKREIDAYIDEIKAAPTAPGFEEVLVAGEPEFILQEQIGKAGIPVARGSFQEICDVCAACGADIDPREYVIG